MQTIDNNEFPFPKKTSAAGSSQSSNHDVIDKEFYTLDDFEELSVPETTKFSLCSDDDKVGVENLKKVFSLKFSIAPIKKTEIPSGK